MFFLLPFYTFHLKSYLCHTNTGFLCMATGKLSSLTGAMQIHEVTIRSDLSMKKKTFQLTPSLRQQKSRRAGKDPLLSLLWMETWNKSLLNILVSLYHQIIITSYLVPLHISKTLIHHCCIATSAKITSRKAISSKIDQKRKICQCDISVIKSHLLMYLNSFQCYVVVLVFGP